jgi:AbiV family abortive infection protein
MSILCYKNAIRLHQDSIFLYKRRSYPSANALSIIAIEEMGKYQSLSHALYYGYFEGGSDDAFIADFLSDMYDHRIKQRVFLNQSWHDVMYADMQRLKKKNLDYDALYKRFMAILPEPNFDDPEFGIYFPNMRKHYRQLHGLESLKQNSLYVGFPRKRGAGSDISAKLHSPFKVGRRTAENQITTLNDHILIQALGVLKGTSGFEIWEEELTAMITPKYVRELRKNWARIANHNLAIIRKLSQLPDEKDSDPE